jgi:hypothetical protein
MTMDHPSFSLAEWFEREVLRCAQDHPLYL